MLVYVISKSGQPLMPTQRAGKVRRMLKSGEAIVVKRCPFTIQLTYESETNTQPIALGVDAGSKHIGVSATTKDRVLYEADVELRDDVVKKLSARREARRTRRNRKTRYRKPRFDNRRRKDGWLAPSVEQKIGTHMQAVERVSEILPITNIVVETASFDVQKINNPDIEGTGYQQGDQMGFWNVREYVLFRDNHECQCCHGKSKDKILNVHHIESRKTGGNAPNNLITLCETCHTGYHKGTVKLPKEIKRGMKFKDATFMGVMRCAFYNRLKEIYPNVSMTYGYITKNTRVENGLPKEHYIDARCISGHPKAVPDGTVYFIRKVRCHNRQLHKFNPSKSGKRKNNQALFEVRGFRLFDKVLYEGQICFVSGRKSDGRLCLRDIDWSLVQIDVNHKKVECLEHGNNYITKEVKAIPHPGKPGRSLAR